MGVEIRLEYLHHEAFKNMKILARGKGFACLKVKVKVVYSLLFYFFALLSWQENEWGLQALEIYLTLHTS